MLLILISAIGFLSGVLLASLQMLEFSWFLLLPIFIKRSFACFFVFLSLGILRVEFEAEAPKILFDFVEIQAEIVGEIDMREDEQKISVQSEYGKILVTTSIYKELNYGDFLFLKGRLEEPGEDEEFSYKDYLARYKIWSLMRDPQIEVIKPAEFSFKGNIYKWKNFLQTRINKIFFEPEASFVSGLLLGSRKSMPQEVAENFQKVGLTHIVAISGYNISLVITAIFTSFSFLGIRKRIFLSIFCISVFVILVGASAAVVRAGFMGSLTLLGLYSGRKSQVLFALLWTCLVMVFINPKILVYDLGFQLSFLSTFAIVSIVPILDEKFPQFNKFFREAFLLSLSAQIITFPLMLFNFGQVSLISPIANIFVAPFIPFAMLFSALALIFGKSFSVFANFHLDAILLIAKIFAKFPLLINWKISASILLMIYTAVIIWLFRFYKPKLVRAFFRADVEVRD